MAGPGWWDQRLAEDTGPAESPGLCDTPVTRGTETGGAERGPRMCPRLRRRTGAESVRGFLAVRPCPLGDPSLQASPVDTVTTDSIPTAQRTKHESSDGARRAVTPVHRPPEPRPAALSAAASPGWLPCPAGISGKGSAR